MILFALALAQVHLDWGNDFGAMRNSAKNNHGLGLFQAGALDSPLAKLVESSTLEDQAVVASLKGVALARNPEQGLRFADPDSPTFVFIDGEGAIVGVARGALPPGLLRDWVKAVKDVWQSHDALIFRAKGRPSDSDLVRLATYYASSLLPDLAANCLGLAQKARPEEREMAWFCQAQALTYLRKGDRAADAWLSVEKEGKSPAMNSVARINLALLWRDTRHEDAVGQLKTVAGSQTSSEFDKKVADYWLSKF
ncbi:MAG: hypothetical protein JSS66_15635 [Armatimonadetes bacterium]|nr:hypothetical protein [Armatimonadota bacterium]